MSLLQTAACEESRAILPRGEIISATATAAATAEDVRANVGGGVE